MWENFKLSKKVFGKYVFVLLLVGAVCMICSSPATAADEDKSKKTLEKGYTFFDPFSLTVISFEGELRVRSTTPILTLREWIRIPYRPPVRSPFLPGI